MKAKNPTTGRIEDCTLLSAYHDGKDWVRFDDGQIEPAANLAECPDLTLEPKHTDTWHDESKRKKAKAPFRSAT